MTPIIIEKTTENDEQTLRIHRQKRAQQGSRSVVLRRGAARRVSRNTGGDPCKLLARKDDDP